MSVGLLLGCGADNDGRPRITARDSTEIESVRSAYVGHRAIRAYWWPNDGSRTIIDSFQWRLDELTILAPGADRKMADPPPDVESATAGLGQQQYPRHVTSLQLPSV